jgi:hypothetical protein
MACCKDREAGIVVKEEMNKNQEDSPGHEKACMKAGLVWRILEVEPTTFPHSAGRCQLDLGINFFQVFSIFLLYIFWQPFAT